MNLYFLPSYKTISGRIAVLKVNGKARISISHDEFVGLIKLLLRGTAFDETWYLATYPDVAEAVQSGTFRSEDSTLLKSGISRVGGPETLRSMRSGT